MTELEARPNPEAGNIWAGWILAHLFESWPLAVNFHPRQAVVETSVKIQNGDGWRAVDDLFQWLVSEGFVRYRQRTIDGECFGVELTEKALARLNLLPASINERKSLGQGLREAAADVGTGATKKALADMFGQFLGGITKSYLA